jgi:hypothetical protein
MIRRHRRRLVERGAGVQPVEVEVEAEVKVNQGN